MTELEERTLKFYLGRVGRIARIRLLKAGTAIVIPTLIPEALYKETLDRARAFAEGYRQACADFRLQVSKLKPRWDLHF